MPPRMESRDAGPATDSPTVGLGEFSNTYALPQTPQRTYAMHLHHDHRPHRPRPWSATLTAGNACLDELVVHARTCDKLIAKTEKKLRRIAASRGITDPIIRIEDAR
jgi:hypothetical protein